MTEWWQSLNGVNQIFWGVAIAATLFQLLMFLSSFFTGHDLDHSTVDDHGGASESSKFFSVRALTAFLVGFGWAGALFLRDGKSLAAATFIAVLVGTIFMGVLLLLMRLLMSLRSSGTLDYANAIGETGHVYVTIPGKGVGQGQVELLLQGRLITALAVTAHEHSLTPQTPVIVEAIEGKNVFVVRRA